MFFSEVSGVPYRLLGLRDRFSERELGCEGRRGPEKTQVREAAFVFALSKPNQRKEGPFSLSCSKSERALFPSPNTNIYKHETYYKSGDPKKRTRTFEMMTGM